MTNSSSKHTPGPWKAEEGIEGEGLAWITGANGHQVCQVYSDYQPKETRNANARLIAAAPALLEALEAMWIAHPEGITGEAARAAIAQAKGE